MLGTGKPLTWHFRSTVFSNVSSISVYSGSTISGGPAERGATNNNNNINNLENFSQQHNY